MASLLLQCKETDLSHDQVCAEGFTSEGFLRVTSEKAFAEGWPEELILRQAGPIALDPQRQADRTRRQAISEGDDGSGSLGGRRKQAIIPPAAPRYLPSLCAIFQAMISNVTAGTPASAAHS